MGFRTEFLPQRASQVSGNVTGEGFTAFIPAVQAGQGAVALSGDVMFGLIRATDGMFVNGMVTSANRADDGFFMDAVVSIVTKGVTDFALSE